LIRSCAAGFLVFVILAGTTRIGAQVVAPPTPSSPAPAPSKSQKQTTAAPKPCTLPGISAQRVQETVDASSMLQPPLAADAMIRISAKVASSCPALAKDLLQRAFDQADSVERETAYKLGAAGKFTDSRISYAEQATCNKWTGFHCNPVPCWLWCRSTTRRQFNSFNAFLHRVHRRLAVPAHLYLMFPFTMKPWGKCLFY